MSIIKTAGRLKAIYYQPRDGDETKLRQTHRNGSDEQVGEITLDNDELEDALYILNRIKHFRDLEN